MSETKRRRIRRSEAEWQRLINEQADSGQPQAVFCAANGISVASFQNWKRRLAAEVSPEPWLPEFDSNRLKISQYFPSFKEKQQLNLFGCFSLVVTRNFRGPLESRQSASYSSDMFVKIDRILANGAASNFADAA